MPTLCRKLLLHIIIAVKINAEGYLFLPYIKKSIYLFMFQVAYV
jgi:hypothetical protein